MLSRKRRSSRRKSRSSRTKESCPSNRRGEVKMFDWRTLGPRALSAAVVAVALSSCGSRPSEPDDKSVTSEADQQRINEIKDEIMVGKGIASKLLGHYGHYDKSPELEKYLTLVGRVVAEQAG